MMPMPPSIQDTKPRIDAALSAFCQQRQAEAASIDPAYGRLWQAICDHSAAGGKRLRAHAILLSYQAYGGVSDIVSVAVAWELLHICLLVHDDIIDRDYKRRGQPNIAGQYLQIYPATTSLEHHANSAALLAGDAAYASAYGAVLGSQLPDHEKLIAVQALANCMFFEASGELLDIESCMPTTAQADAEKIAHLKTAHYSLIEPLTLGARLASAPASEVQKLEQFGVAAGIGFQLADDLLGMFGDEAITGKPATSDLREGKRTMLLQELGKRAPAGEQKRLQHIVSNPRATEEEVEFVRQLAIKYGAKRAVETRIRACQHKALSVLKTLSIQPAFAKALENLVIATCKH